MIHTKQWLMHQQKRAVNHAMRKRLGISGVIAATAMTVVVTFLTSGLAANALGSGTPGKGDHITIVSYATHCQFRVGCYKTSATLADDGTSDVEYVARSGATPVLYHPGNTFGVSMRRVSTTLSCSSGWLYFIEGHNKDGTPILSGGYGLCA